mmetsp:Transcript_137550/g.325788  ORF Transcript_137550/g.325788 Transcript_137550/m.325788 type:complete len:212 (+) Transcript_137550:110-745(+)
MHRTNAAYLPCTSPPLRAGSKFCGFCCPAGRSRILRTDKDRHQCSLQLRGRHVSFCLPTRLRWTFVMPSGRLRCTSWHMLVCMMPSFACWRSSTSPPWTSRTVKAVLPFGTLHAQRWPPLPACCRVRGRRFRNAMRTTRTRRRFKKRRCLAKTPPNQRQLQCLPRPKLKRQRKQMKKHKLKRPYLNPSRPKQKRWSRPWFQRSMWRRWKPP